MTAEFLVLIPARGGSKRLPRKNVLPLLGKPMIAWSIEAGLKAGVSADVMVSTDDDEIAAVAKRYGAFVPGLRPKKLGKDKTSTQDVVRYTLDWYKKNQGKTFESIILLQPTSPLRTAEDVQLAVQLYRQKEASSVVSVSAAPCPPSWCHPVPDSLSLTHFANADKRQKGPFFRLNGAVYITKTSYFLKHDAFLSKTRGYAYVMPPERSVDVDTALDFTCAEAIASKILHHPENAL